MAQDGVDTDAVPVPIDRDHVPRRRIKRCVIAATSLCRQRDRKNLQRQSDLAHAHSELNGKTVDEEESQDE